MSRKSNDWAWNQNLAPTLKLTLLSLADRTNEVHECFPSYARLVTDTGLNIKTIQKNINLLLAAGIIQDTGKRKGRLKRIKVLKFTFKFDENDVDEIDENDEIPINPKVGGLENDSSVINPKVGGLKHPKVGGLNPPKSGMKNHPALEPPNRTTQIEKRSKNETIKTNKKQPKSTAVWNAYALAYENKNGHEPIRSAKVNKQLCLFVDEVGHADAPAIAEYYLYLNNKWYLEKGHDVATLLQNAQAIRTQWLNQSNHTSIDHRTNERRASTLNAANRVKAQIARGEL